MNDRESDLEKYLVKEVRRVGGQCYKFVSPGCVGVPDRICCFPGGLTVFIEVKKPGESLEPIQLVRHRELRDVGQPVCAADSTDEVDAIVSLARELRRSAK